MTTRIDLSRLRILVLEDSWPMTQLLSAVLRGFGIRGILVASDVEAAAATAQSEHVDLAFVDLVLGRDDGLRFIRIIRQRHSVCPTLPIVVLSSHTSVAHVKAAVLAGANDVLHKPISTKALYGHMAALILNPQPFVSFGAWYVPLPRSMPVERARRMSEADWHRAVSQPFERATVQVAADADADSIRPESVAFV